MSSYFSTTHLFSVTYEFVLSLVDKSPFMLSGRTHQNAFASKSFDR